MKKIIFAGTGEVAVQVMQQIFTQVNIVAVLTREDAPVGRKRVISPSPIALLAEEMNIPVLKSNKPGTLPKDQISAFGADMGIVVSYGALLPENILQLMDWYNVHFSLLPQLRGAAPVQWGLIQGLEQTGVSVFKLDSGMDTGDIFGQKKMAIDSVDTTMSLLPKLAKHSISLLVDLVNTDKPVLYPQHGESSLAPKLSRAQARIDFSEPSQTVCNLIRGCYPEPTAWANLRGGTLKVISAIPANHSQSTRAYETAAIGTLGVTADLVTVTCGENSLLELQRVQPAGKGEMSAIEWSRGLNGEVRFD